VNEKAASVTHPDAGPLPGLGAGARGRSFQGRRGRALIPMRFLILAAGVLMVLPAAVARADDISDQINEALRAYEKHDLATTAAALDAASNLLRQAKAEAWKAMLPEPLAGWTAADAESTTVANAMFGGGTGVSRTYKKADQSIEITYIADSPMMQGLGSLMSSGLVTGNDIKLLIIDGRKVTYSKSDNSYTTMVGKVLVSIKGQGVDDASLRSYLKAIKFTDLEKASN
jgi:hypothetical protein